MSDERVTRITAVVLAAGESRRMGRSKQLLPWGETTVLGRTLDNVQATTIDAVVVVTGHEAEAVEAIAQDHGLPAVHNPDYADGEMISSLQAALRALRPVPAGVLVVLADQPLVEPALMDGLLAAFREEKGGLVAPVYQGRRGNPVVIGRRYFDELLALSRDAMPRVLLERHREALHLVEVASESVLIDLDRPEAYERWRP